VAIFNDLMVPVALGGKDDSLKIIKLNVKETPSQEQEDGGIKSTRRTLRGGNTNRSHKSG
jgi:hypothetical protein